MQRGQPMQSPVSSSSSSGLSPSGPLTRSGGGGGPTTTERLAFSIQLKRLVMDAPAKLALHHSIYIKWTRGKFFRGKCQPVPCPARTHIRHNGGGDRPQIEVELPSAHQIHFEVNVHSKLQPLSATTSSGTRGGGGGGASLGGNVTMERKTLDLEIYFLRYEDHTRVDLKSRTLITRLTIDLREWLADARVGHSCTFLSPFGRNSLIDGVFVVSPVKASLKDSRRLSSRIAQGMAGGDDYGDDDDGEGAEAALDFPFAATTGGGDDVGGDTILLDAEALLKSIAGTSSPHGSSMETIIDEGLFRAVTIHNPVTISTDHREQRRKVVATIYDRLFSDQHGRLGTVLHAARGDQGYEHKPFDYVHHHHQQQQQHMASRTGAAGGGRHPGGGATAAVTASPPQTVVGGVKSVPFRLRIAKEKFVDAVEVTTVCSLRGDIVVHIGNTAPSAPIVGNGLRLETVVHITPNVPRAATTQQVQQQPSAAAPAGGGSTGSHGGTLEPVCTIAVYVYVAVSSSKLKFMLGSKIQHHAEKILLLLEQVVKQLTAATRGAGALRPLRGSTRFRSSLNGGNGGTAQLMASLDPNLWRRLGDEHTLPRSDLVLQTLKRLVPVVSQHRQSTSMHVQTLENVMGYHRQDVPVVTAALQLMMLLVKVGGGASSIANCSVTLPATVRGIQGLHPPGTFEFVESTMRQIEVSAAALKEHRQREAIGIGRNLWAALQSNAGDSEVVDYVLERLLHGSSLSSRTPLLQEENRANLLTMLLSLHLQVRRICEGICVLLDGAKDLNSVVDGNLAVALREAHRAHPSLAARCPQLLPRVEAACKGFTGFQKTFGAIVHETPIFECVVGVESPSWKAGKLYVTRSYLCIVDAVIPLANMRRVELFRSLLRPAVRLFMIATIPDYDIVLLSRGSFLEALRTVGCGWMIRDGDE